MKFTLKEIADDFPQDEFPGEVRCEKDDLALFIEVDGYGEFCTRRGGAPIILERFRGRLRLVVWADINSEDPTDIIDLEGARESERLAINCETLLQDEVDTYIARDGVKCPYCKSDDLHCGDWDTRDHAVYRSVTCGKCDSNWTDEYRLTGVTEG